MTEFLSEAELRKVLVHWRDPDRLASHPICQRPLIRSRIVQLVTPTAVVIGNLVQGTIEEALHRLSMDGHYVGRYWREIARDKPLIKEHYIEDISVNEICSRRNISSSTYFRTVRQELSALAIVLAEMEAALYTNTQKAENAHTDRMWLNVPAPPTHYVNRRDVTESILRALETNGEENALAIVGLPGSGKSALVAALMTTPEVACLFPDGVLWADLGPSGNVERCLSEWHTALGTVAPWPEHQTVRELRASLRSMLANKRALIVIDDVWSLAAAKLLLVGGVNARHIVTTRSPALGFAITDRNVVLAEFAIDEAKCLIERNLGRDAVARLGDQFLDHVSRTLNRLPLAVHLTARHLAYLVQTEQINRLQDFAQELERRPLIHGHAALDTEISLSFDALEPDVRVVASSFTLLPPKPNTIAETDALAITGSPRAALDSLVDAGLLETRHGRMTMHEAIHQYLVRNHSQPDSVAEQRLVKHFADVLHDDPDRLSSADLSNIAVAIQAARRLGDVTTASELIWNAAWLFESAGEFGQLEKLIDNALQHEMKDVVAAPLLAERARLHWLQGEPNAREELENYRLSADRLGLYDVGAVCEHTLSYIEAEHAQEETAIALSEHALQVSADRTADVSLARAEISAVRRLVTTLRFDLLRSMMIRMAAKLANGSTNKTSLALAQAVVAWLDYLKGKIDGAESLLVDIAKQPHCHTHGLTFAITHGALAFICRNEGRYLVAENYAAGMIQSDHRASSPEFTALAYDVLSQCSLARGDFQAAQLFLGQGLEYASEHRSWLMLSALHASACGWHLRCGDVAMASSHADSAVQNATAASDDVMCCAAYALRALAASRSGDFERADQLFDLAHRRGHIGSNRQNLWSALQFHLRVGEHSLAKGELAPARSALNVAHQLAQQLRARESEGLTMILQAQVAYRCGELEVARATRQAGLTLLKSLGHEAAANAEA